MTPALSAAIRVINEAGFAVVPRVATRAMEDAGQNAHCADGFRLMATWEQATACFEDMLAAGEVKPNE